MEGEIERVSKQDGVEREKQAVVEGELRKVQVEQQDIQVNIRVMEKNIGEEKQRHRNEIANSEQLLRDLQHKHEQEIMKLESGEKEQAPVVKKLNEIIQKDQKRNAELLCKLGQAQTEKETLIVLSDEQE